MHDLPTDPKDPTRPVTLRFSVALWAWVKRTAPLEGRSASNFVQHLVRLEYLRRTAPPRKRPRHRRRPRDLVPIVMLAVCARSAIAAIATNLL